MKTKEAKKPHAKNWKHRHHTHDFSKKSPRVLVETSPNKYIDDNLYPLKLALTHKQIKSLEYTPVLIEALERKAKQLASVKQVVDIVAQYFQLTDEEITRKTNKHTYSHARAICHYFFYMYGVPGLTLASHAKYFNHDHALLIYHAKKVRGSMEYDRELREDIENLKKLINKYTEISI